MQHTHEDFNDYPEDLQVKDVNVYIHPSGMIMTHDYSCPVCREDHAILSRGIMQPCWKCQEKGYTIVKKNLTKKWFQFWRKEYV